MKVFLTGGTGFIGSHLIEVLQAQGEEIFALIRDSARATWAVGKKINLLHGDLFSIPALPSGIDLVFHLAGKTKVRSSADYYTANLEGTASLFRALAASRASPRVVCLSSLAAAGPSRSAKGVKESDPARPVTHYGLSKLQAEEEALRYKDRFPLVIIRACAIYGPQDADFLHFFRWISRGILPTVPGRRLISLCYVKDLIQALILCGRKNLPSGEILNIADPRPYTWEEMGEAAGRVLGKRLKKLIVPLPLLYFFASLSELINRFKSKPSIISRQKYLDFKQSAWIADVSKARELLSFQPRFDLETGLNETLDWYVEQGWL
ncbi:MAG: NAD-dependent epimerase/dehydratase family protein [Clostridiales bacterium]|nr:NAD-dependent epimerase/dehydratase family protein [Clostridiales bacterium]